VSTLWGAHLRPSWSGVRIAGPSYDGSGGTNTVGWNVGGGTPGGAGGSCRGGKRRSKISAMYLRRIRNADLGGRAQLRKGPSLCGGNESDAAIACARWPVRRQRDARAHMTRLPCAFSVDADGTGRRHGPTARADGTHSRIFSSGCGPATMMRIRSGR
jgi:hypothetical protein